jgi:hypothetical protein
MYGGDDGARTRDLCRDSEKEGRNLQKTSVTDGFFWRCKARSGTVIEPISNPRPLPCKPLPHGKFCSTSGKVWSRQMTVGLTVREADYWAKWVADAPQKIVRRKPG